MYSGALMKLWHVVDGLYLLVISTAAHSRSRDIVPFRWEFVATFDYEWSVIQGHRPYRRTIWVCNEELLLALARHLWSLELIYLVGRFTPLRVSPPS